MYNPPSSMTDTVQFLLGTSVFVCLKFDPPGREVQSTRGGRRFMFTLTDGRKMFLDEREAAFIEKHFRAGEEFWICKRKVGKEYTFQIWRGGAEARRGPDLTDDLARSIEDVNARKAARPAAAPAAWENSFRDERPAPAPPPIETLPARREPAQAGAAAQMPSPAAAQRTQLAWALCTAIQACSEAQEYARTINFSVSFSSEDVRTMANTLVIGKQQRGAA